MGMFSSSTTVTAAAAGSAYACFKAGAGNGAKIRVIEIFNPVATLLPVQVARMNVAGVTPVAAVNAPYDLTSAAATAALEKSWATPPSVTTGVLKKATIAATIGTGMIWTFLPDAPLIVPISGGIVLWNPSAAAGPAFDLNIEWFE